MRIKDILLHISLIDGIGPSIIQKIYTTLAHDEWANVYSFTVSDFIRHCCVNERIAQVLVCGLRDASFFEKEQNLLERHGIDTVTLFDEEYPELLKNIHVPPAILYWRGISPAFLQKKIALVGSRKADEYGRRIIEMLVPSLVEYQYTIVSGGAVGIDSMAHWSAIDHGGATIVVLGSGLLEPYPSCNKKLFDRAQQEGAVISAFSLQTKPNQGNFPARNRIIAGMSSGTVVVQAAEKSGARITAQYALEQGRNVFAVPGTIDDPLAVGCHRLIQEGAQLVTHVSDILAEYGIQKPQEVQSKIPLKKHNYAPDSIESSLIKVCVSAQSIDELAAHTSLSLSELQALLFNLQLEGILKQEFTGMWKTA